MMHAVAAKYTATVRIFSRAPARQATSTMLPISTAFETLKPFNKSGQFVKPPHATKSGKITLRIRINHAMNRTNEGRLHPGLIVIGRNAAEIAEGRIKKMLKVSSNNGIKKIA